MRAYAHRNQDLSMLFASAALLVAIFWQWHGERLFRCWISQLTFCFGQTRHHFRRAFKNPNRLTAPFHRRHCARRQIGNIDLNRRTGGFRPLRWLQGRHKGACCGQSNHPTRRACSDEQATSTWVNLLFDTHTNPNPVKNIICPKLLATLDYSGAERAFKAIRFLAAILGSI